MTIIISENGKNAARLEESNFSLEDNLQEYIYDNPDTIPLYTIDKDTRLFIAAREFGTQSGPIDALGFDARGNIYVVETKLFKNPDKRKVVAQALDYGASLWRHSSDFDEFLTQLDHHTQKQFGKAFQQEFEVFFGVEADPEYLGTIKTNLSEGVIRFVVLMDKLDSKLKDLVVFVNQNSKFDIFAVELEYYKHATFEIVIPRIYGTEVKKELTSVRQPAGGQRHQWSESEYWQEVNTNLSPVLAAGLRSFYDWAVEKADRIKWGTGSTRGSFNPVFEAISPRSFVTFFTDGAIQVSYAYLPVEDGDESKKALRDTLNRYIPTPGVTDVPDDKIANVWPSFKPAVVEAHAGDILNALEEFIAEVNQ